MTVRKAAVCAMTFVTISLLMLPQVMADAVEGSAPGTMWSKDCGGNARGYSVQQAMDGGYIIAGATHLWEDMYLVKTDSSGNVQWHRTYGGSASECAYSVLQTSDGGYVLAGYTESYVTPGSARNVYIIKTDLNGELVWSKSYGGKNYAYALSMDYTSDGGFILTGIALPYKPLGGGSSEDVYLLKTDSNGNMEWDKIFEDDSGPEEAWSVQQTSDGGYVIGGWTHGVGMNDFYLIKTDSSGNMQWDKTYGGSGNDQAYSVQQANDGGYVITGHTDSFGGGTQAYLVKADSNGNMMWQKTYKGIETTYADSVQQTSDGGYVIAGATYELNKPGEIYLVRTNSNGNVLWGKTYGTGEASSFQPTSDGGYIILSGFVLLKTETDTIVSGTVTNGVLDAKSKSDTEVYVTGSGAVAVGKYSSTPATPTFTAVGKYLDVLIDSASGITELKIRFYYTDNDASLFDEASLKMYWWTGSEWVLCNPQTLHIDAVNDYSGYIEVTAQVTGTTPTLNELVGTPFGFGGSTRPIIQPVGGVVVPTNKLEIVTPYLALAGLVIAVSTVAVVKKRRD